MEEGNFPGVIGQGVRRSLRFAVPKINFSPDTLAVYEEQAGVPYLSVLEQVRAQDEASIDGSDAAEVQKAIKALRASRKSESTAQGMLFYLANLWQKRSRVGAIQPPVSSSMVTWWRRAYPFFDETVADFEEELSDAAEDELYQRAVLGVDQEVIVNGQREFLNKKSDDLLKYYLTHNRPKRYSQRSESVVKQKTEMTGAGGGPLVVAELSSLRGLTDDELGKMEELLKKGLGAS